MIWTLKLIPNCQVEVNATSALHLASGMLPFPTPLPFWTQQPWSGCTVTLTSYLKLFLCIESKLNSLKCFRCCMTTCWVSLETQTVKDLPEMQTWVHSLGQEDPREEEVATDSNILAWRIPWTEEHGRLQYMGGKEPDMTEQLTQYTICPLITSSHSERF